MIFKMLIDGESSQLIALNALHDTWKNHQQVNEKNLNLDGIKLLLILNCF